MYGGPGAKVFDDNIAYGLFSKRGNPKRKARLPYHAKKVLNLQVMPSKSTCTHALSRHEEITFSGKTIIASYALQCNVSHKAATKNPTHKDVTKRSWK